MCIRHGAKVKLCSFEGCTNQVVKIGVCIRHGAKKGNALRKKPKVVAEPKVSQSTKREVVQFDCTVLPLKIICDMSHL